MLSQHASRSVKTPAALASSEGVDSLLSQMGYSSHAKAKIANQTEDVLNISHPPQSWQLGRFIHLSNKKQALLLSLQEQNAFALLVNRDQDMDINSIEVQEECTQHSF